MTGSHHRWPGAAAHLVAALLLAAGCREQPGERAGPGASASAAAPVATATDAPPPLPALDSSSRALEERFTADRDKTRLVLLLSPT